MAVRRKKIQALVIFLLFVIYFFIAARPVPREIVLAPQWINSLDIQPDISPESGSLITFDSTSGHIANRWSDKLIPFTLGDHFGYVDTSGRFSINRIKTSEIYLGENMWTEYSAEPSSIEISNVSGVTLINIENVRGYPVLLDNRIFIFGSEQNELSEIGPDGNVLWTYEFGAPLTCIDVSAGLVLTGSIDGTVEILDSNGERIFIFEPGGSRYEVILGCALSQNGSLFGIICGIEPQRFLLFERFSGGEYKVIHHEFLETGFRRPVHILFIDEDRRVIFEREGGISSYNLRSRRGIYIPLNGDITAIDGSGDQGFLFLVTSNSPERNELIGIKFSNDRRFALSRFTSARDVVFMRAPFRSPDVFLGRVRTEGSGSMLIAGGGTTLISLVLEEK